MRGVRVERLCEIVDFAHRLLVAAAMREDRIEPPPQRFVEDGMIRNPRLRERQFHADRVLDPFQRRRSEEHTSELQSLMRISYAVFCLKKKKNPRIRRRTPRRLLTTALIPCRHLHQTKHTSNNKPSA